MDQQYQYGGAQNGSYQYQQPQYSAAPQPVVMPPQQSISGGAKAGMFCGGMFLGCLCIVIMYLFSQGRDDASARECAKWTMFGMIANVVLAVLFIIFFAVFLVSLLATFAAIG